MRYSVELLIKDQEKYGKFWRYSC